MLQHILAAVDGSESSRKAARFASDLAKQVNGRLTLLYVLEPPHLVPVGFESFVVTGPTQSQESIEAARKLLEKVSQELPHSQVQRVVEVGQTAEVICEQADKLKADMIVVGARGTGKVARWLLGSTSDRVVHHARQTVTVVR